MPEIVDAHVVEPGTRPDAPPRVLQVGEVASGLAAGDRPRIVRVARQYRLAPPGVGAGPGVRAKAGRRGAFGPRLPSLPQSRPESVMPDPDTFSADYSLRPGELAGTLALLVEARQPAIVWGPPGCAKSQIARQVAADAGREYIDVRAVLSLRSPRRPM